jgi:acyl dehydratase
MTGRYIEDFNVGEVITTARRTVTEADIVIFTGLSGDYNPLHVDEVYAKDTPHGTRIAQGLLGTAIATGLTGQTGMLRGTAIGLLGMTCKYTGTIKAGDTIHVVQTVVEARKSSKPGRGVLTRKIEIVNQRGEVVQTGEWAVLVKSRDAD